MSRKSTGCNIYHFWDLVMVDVIRVVFRWSVVGLAQTKFTTQY